MSQGRAGLDLSVDPQGIAHLVFDRGGDGLNILDSQVMERLEGFLTDLESRKDPPKGLVVRSARPDSFIVGADVEEIAKLASASEAERKS
ncbi:MAG: fatty acid oxidation complex subunit alpha FadJ, partial [Acidobacteria bacterium]|nr:fatty acid oxidation complex subunit alpha FadJ [Acidobacteriota bacterium]